MKYLRLALQWITRLWFMIPPLFVYCAYRIFHLMSGYYSTEEGLWSDAYFLLLFLYIVAQVNLLRQDKFVQFLLSLIPGAVMAFTVVSIGMAAQSAPTRFGIDHPIPEGLAYENVLPADSILTQEPSPADTASWLQIYRGSQGGIYEYTLYAPPLLAGEVFLRCYEVTENIALSKRRLRKASRCPVEASETFSRIVDRQRFTIYEGDWGDYYAVRVEVWHHPRSGKEQKLLEKVYAMEGWMR
ncbi:MAG: hypothetical protein K5945_05395 [Bacteroidaceae bacterium]|nr:hypothetical protein [Bacteroidaceae bacterium]